MTIRGALHPTPDPTGPGQESVWSYPRPPRLEATDRRLWVGIGSTTVGETRSGLRVLETSHAPGYYLPPDDCNADFLSPSPGTTVCEWKGRAVYWDVTVDGVTHPRAAWSYPEPTPEFEAIRDHLAFYPSLVECAVDGAAVTPQPGRFYGGWVTPDVTGPFKGSPGSSFW